MPRDYNMIDGGGYSAPTIATPSIADAMGAFKETATASKPAASNASAADAVSKPTIDQLQAAADKAAYDASQNRGNGPDAKYDQRIARETAAALAAAKAAEVKPDTTTLPFDTTSTNEPAVLGGDGKILGENNTTVEQRPVDDTGFVTPPVITDPNKDASGVTQFSNPNLSPGAGGAGPEAAATNTVQEEIKRLTDQIANMQKNQAAEAAKPKAIGVKTVRKTGGVVETVEVMSDGSQGKTIDSYKDFGAKDAVMKMFENTGLGADFIKSLSDTIDKVYQENIMPTDTQLTNSIYSSDAYKQRFAANEEIRKRMANGEGRPGDKLLTPYEYIQTEQAYREIMQNASLPAGFYDNQDDFTKLISNSISASELTSRVNLASQALQNADQATVDALKNYYGWSTADLTAYLLDSEKAFNLVDSRFKYTTEEAKKIYGAAEIGGAGLRAGGDLSAGGLADRAFAEEIYKSGKGDRAEQAFQASARDQGDYSRLLGLAGDTAGSQDLAREQLGLAGGTDVALKTKKLASAERARFKQQSAIGSTSLLRGRKQRSDV